MNYKKKFQTGGNTPNINDIRSWLINQFIQNGSTEQDAIDIVNTMSDSEVSSQFTNEYLSDTDKGIVKANAQTVQNPYLEQPVNNSSNISEVPTQSGIQRDDRIRFRTNDLPVIQRPNTNQALQAPTQRISAPQIVTSPEVPVQNEPVTTTESTPTIANIRPGNRGVFSQNYGMQGLGQNRGQLTYNDNTGTGYANYRAGNNPMNRLQVPQFLKDGFNKIKQGFANRKAKAQARKEAERWYDEQQENKSLRDRIKDKRGKIRDAEKEERLDKKGSRLERTLNSLNNRLAREESRNPRTTRLAEERSNLNQDIDDIKLNRNIVKDKGNINTRNERMKRLKYNQLKRQEALMNTEPFIQGKKAEGQDILTESSKVRSDNRSSNLNNRRIDRGNNTLNRSNDRSRSIRNNQEIKSINRNLKRFNREANKDIRGLKRLKSNTKDPVEKQEINDVINIQKENHDNIRKNIISNINTDAQEIPNFKPVRQLGGNIGDNKFSMFDPNYLQMNQTPDLGLDTRVDQGLQSKLGYTDPRAAATMNIKSNQLFEKPTISNNPALNNKKSKGNFNLNIKNPFAKSSTNTGFDNTKLHTHGNRMQSQGLAIPAYYNMVKMFDDPEVETAVNPRFVQRRRYVNPNMLEVNRQNEATRRMIAGSARGAGNYMANVQQMHANSTKLAQQMANQAKMQNIAEDKRIDGARQQYENQLAQEKRRIDSRNLQHKLAKQNAISETATQMGKYYLQKGILHNSELEDYNRLQTYVNQISPEYQVVPSGGGVYEIVHKKTGVKMSPDQFNNTMLNIQQENVNNAVDPNNKVEPKMKGGKIVKRRYTL